MRNLTKSILSLSLSYQFNFIISKFTERHPYEAQTISQIHFSTLSKSLSIRSRAMSNQHRMYLMKLNIYGWPIKSQGGKFAFPLGHMKRMIHILFNLTVR